MEPIYRTGNETVDRLSRISITGNVIPAAWYRTITRDTGKPYLNAIVILSDIVYWYRAAEVREEGSGQLVGYRKRFKADLLQRSYQQLSDQFGISKRDATNAIVALEQLGVIKRVFRTLTVNGQPVPNVLFLELNVEILEQLTYPQEGCHLFEGDVSPKPERGVTEISETVSPKSERPVTQTGETNTEITDREYDRDYPIQSYQEEKERFKRQIEYEILKHDMPEEKTLDELVELAVEVLTSKAEVLRVNREDRPASLVKEQYRRLNMMHIRYVLNCLRENETKARNIRAVMITALYNSVTTIGSYYDNLYQYHTAKG